MAAIISTYRHDYIPPATNRYSFVKKVEFTTDPCKEICPCVEELPKPNLSALGEICETKTWTGPAPPGKMVDPRIIPQAPLLPQQDNNACWMDQPNRFLKTIVNTYPDLYARLKNMPPDELRRSIENSRFRTTYQVDYCHLDEHPAGSYDQTKEKAEEEQYRISKLNEPCELFQQNNDFQMKAVGNVNFNTEDGFGKELDAEETKLYKPMKTNFAEEKSRGPSGHYDSGPFTKQLALTEYMDKLGRTGLIILENNLHDHTNCRHGRNCNHTIRNKDPKGIKELVHSHH